MDWENYLTPIGKFEACRSNCLGSFFPQRKKIHNLFEILSPRSVLCMGSGYLNDIPIEDFLKAGASIYLVDWAKNISREAYCKDIVAKEEGGYNCCISKAKDPQKYCQNFVTQKLFRNQNVCAGFKASAEAPSLCASFEFNSEPSFLEEDVTQGKASAFAARISSMLPEAKSPKAVFKNALKEVNRLKNHSQALPVEDHSIDLVTSSMVVSQFEHEPYGFMTQMLMEKFGKETLAEMEKNLNPYMEKLRDALFLLLAEGHFQEIHRVLTENGRAYFSLENFHWDMITDRWFQVRNFSATLEIMEKYFWFDFDTLPGSFIADRVGIMGDECIVQTYVLEPKH
ncbi:MAG: hypothetical protein H8E42_10545 [Nitrospinae bacterium]|nr:hypothetical protein [Nitrospinota bacterium]MBL7019756.1 hypothetical protein [Nitrospinaceae bacterium]